jgi:peroxiredoxin
VAGFALAGLICIPVLLDILVQRATHESSLQPGDAVPPATLQDLHGNRLAIADYRGKRLALIFFKVDCSHCQRGLARLDPLCYSFKEEINFLAVSLSDARSTEEFVQTNQLKMKAVLDIEGEARHAFGVAELPALFLVNEQQVIRYRMFGEQPMGAMRKLLTAFCGTQDRAIE